MMIRMVILQRSNVRMNFINLLLGTKFKMKMKNVESKVYNCPLSWWKTSAGRYMNIGKLVIKYLAVPATSAPSERIWS